jgi:hypothetical protein
MGLPAPKMVYRKAVPGERIAGMGYRAKRSNWKRFIGIVSGLLAPLFFILQANGVAVNWWQSLALYILIGVVGVVAYLRHAVPDSGRVRQYASALLLLVLVALLGSIGTVKQYHADHKPHAQSLPPCPPGVGPDIDGFATYNTTVGVEIHGQPCMHLKNVKTIGGQKGLDIDPSTSKPSQ